MSRLSLADKNAVIATANRMGVDPNALAGLIHMESGFRPNVWGGAGGNYRGLIQFGPGAREEVGLPAGDMTIEAQMPYVERYFNQRGFKPGMSTEQMYRTVLVGNPHTSGTDSFGTNSDATGKRMAPGGDLYNAGKSYLEGATLTGTTTATASRSGGSPTTGLDPNGAGSDVPDSLPLPNKVALSGLNIDMAQALEESSKGRMAGTRVPGLLEGSQQQLGNEPIDSVAGRDRGVFQLLGLLS